MRFLKNLPSLVKLTPGCAVLCSLSISPQLQFIMLVSQLPHPNSYRQSNHDRSPTISSFSCPSLHPASPYFPQLVGLCFSCLQPSLFWQSASSSLHSLFHIILQPSTLHHPPNHPLLVNLYLVGPPGHLTGIIYPSQILLIIFSPPPPPPFL